MVRDEVVTSLTNELIFLTGSPEHAHLYRAYINMALDVGINHFTKDMEEVLQLTPEGKLIKKFKGITDASVKLGIKQGDISAVITGRQHTARGFMFMKAEARKRPEFEFQKS